MVYNHVGASSLNNYGSLQMNSAASILNWTAAGNVGIGTTNPAVKLQVYGTAYPGLVINSPTTALELLVNTGGSPYQTIIRSNTRMDLECPANYPRLTIEPGGGNVGIGTTNPTTQFHIYKSSYTGMTIQSGVNYSYVYGFNDALFLSANYTATGAISNSARATSYINMGMPNSGGSSIAFGTSSAINTLATTKMTIDSSGNVGIGVTNPSATLHVNGNARFRSGLCSGRVAIASLADTGYAEYTMADIAGDGINTTYLITATSTTNGGYYAYGFAYNWNPTLLSLTQLTSVGITLSIGGASKLRITNTSGTTRDIVVCVTAMGI